MGLFTHYPLPITHKDFHFLLEHSQVGRLGRTSIPQKVLEPLQRYYHCPWSPSPLIASKKGFVTTTENGQNYSAICSSYDTLPNNDSMNLI